MIHSNYHYSIGEDEMGIFVRADATDYKIYPCCGKDVLGYYNYLVSSRHGIRAGQIFLSEIIRGEEPISKLIPHADHNVKRARFSRKGA
jgi:hypothetical protein